MDLWKDIPNFEGLYQASINGEIRSVNHIRKNGTNEYKQKGKILKFTKNHSGYSFKYLESEEMAYRTLGA